MMLFYYARVRDEAMRAIIFRHFFRYVIYAAYATAPTGLMNNGRWY